MLSSFKLLIIKSTFTILSHCLRVDTRNYTKKTHIMNIFCANQLIKWNSSSIITYTQLEMNFSNSLLKTTKDNIEQTLITFWNPKTTHIKQKLYNLSKLISFWYQNLSDWDNDTSIEVLTKTRRGVTKDNIVRWGLAWEWRVVSHHGKVNVSH